MLLWILQLLSHYLKDFHVFGYLTFRAILSTLTALGITWLLGPYIIHQLKSYKVGQIVRNDGPQSHLQKSGTPTMGGLLILIAIVFTTLLWADLSNYYIWVLLLITVGFGCIGGIDDYRKLLGKNPKGLSAYWKFFWQSLLAFIAVIILFYSAHTPHETQLVIPFFKNVVINMGIWFLVLGYFVIVGSSNAVNLTDGLDGLATMPIILIAAGLGVFSYASGNIDFSHYLLIPYLPRVGEVIIVIGAIIGAGLGFLWYNTYPAQVFMGDIGSLPLGAILGTIAIVVRQEIVFFIMSGIFVMETLSVILQVAWFKLMGKRLFRMAPIHHHFELKGWPEPRIIVRFWILTVMLVLLGLATLKLR